MTSQKDAGGAFVGGHGEYEIILFTARATSFVRQLSPWSIEGTIYSCTHPAVWPVCIISHQQRLIIIHHSALEMVHLTLLSLHYIATLISYGL